MMPGQHLSNRALADFLQYSGDNAEVYQGGGGGEGAIGTPTHVASGTITDSYGKKIAGWIRTKIKIGKDGEPKTETTFKPFGNQGVDTKEFVVSKNANMTSPSAKLVRMMGDAGFDIEKARTPTKDSRDGDLSRRQQIDRAAGEREYKGVEMLGNKPMLSRGLVRNRNEAVSIQDVQKGDDQGGAAAEAGSAGGGTWDGLITFKSVPIESSPGSGFTVDTSVSANLQGKYIKVHLRTGAWSWADTIGADTFDYTYRWVCDLITAGTPNVYALNNHTQGSICIDVD